MKGFERNNWLLSLCGLNCGLCSMFIGKYCPSCGAGDGNQGCKIARCGMERGNTDYCFRCEAYPCDRYDRIDENDSFITTVIKKLIWRKHAVSALIVTTKSRKRK